MYISGLCSEFDTSAITLFSWLTEFLLPICAVSVGNNSLMPVICPNKTHPLRWELHGGAHNRFLLSFFQARTTL